MFEPFKFIRTQPSVFFIDTLFVIILLKMRCSKHLRFLSAYKIKQTIRVFHNICKCTTRSTRRHINVNIIPKSLSFCKNNYKEILNNHTISRSGTFIFGLNLCSKLICFHLKNCITISSPNKSYNTKTIKYFSNSPQQYGIMYIRLCGYFCL